MRRARWEQLAGTFRQSVCDITAADRAGVIASIVEGTLGESARGTLVDLGCGRGTFIRRFGGRFSRVIGVDFAASVLEQARRRCRDLGPVEWRAADIVNETDDLRESADLAVSLNVITSASPAKRAALWRSLYAVTRRGGAALVVVPSLESHGVVRAAARGLGIRLAASGAGGVVSRGADRQKYFRASEVLRAIENAGFDPVFLAVVPYDWRHEGLPSRRDPSRPPWDWLVLALKTDYSTLRRRGSGVEKNTSPPAS
jgi:2-polyprenyl-3-methyl-5-hydroxy-6-metoxy-1,4-benzoquinol methylase